MREAQELVLTILNHFLQDISAVSTAPQLLEHPIRARIGKSMDLVTLYFQQLYLGATYRDRLRVARTKIERRMEKHTEGKG